jgi:hypothetical protein
MAGKQLKTMDVGALLELRGKIDALLAGRRQELEAQLAAFNGVSPRNGAGNGKPAKPLKANGLDGRKGKRAKAAAKYQSKKDKSVKWSGRGKDREARCPDRESWQEPTRIARNG